MSKSGRHKKDCRKCTILAFEGSGPIGGERLDVPRVNVLFWLMGSAG